MTALHQELHPDLRDRLQVGTIPGSFTLYHPLVIKPFYTEDQAEQVNQQYELKRTMLTDAWNYRVYEDYIMLHERPYRITALLQVADLITTHPEHWKLVGMVWQDSENIYQHLAAWEIVFNSERPAKECMMNKAEQQVYSQFKDVVEVYRGSSPENLEGYSWTLSKQVAEQFAARSYAGNPLISYSAVDPEDIHAYFNGRDEQEIIINPAAMDSRVITAYKG